MDSQQFQGLQFDAKISHGCSGEYRIWIPKEILSKIPDGTWFITSVKIRKEGFVQTFSKRPLSKTGGSKRYIPIYNSDVMIDYSQLGKVHVEIEVYRWTTGMHGRGRFIPFRYRFQSIQDQD